MGCNWATEGKLCGTQLPHVVRKCSVGKQNNKRIVEMTRSISRWKCEEEEEWEKEQAVAAAATAVMMVVTMPLKNWLPLVENAMRCDDKLLVLFNKSFDLGLTFADAARFLPVLRFHHLCPCMRQCAFVRIALHIPRVGGSTFKLLLDVIPIQIK